jgi:hypothetical protein
VTNSNFRDKKRWLLTLSAGFFLFFVLYFYEGFGIPKGVSSMGYGLFFRSVCFGLLAVACFFFNEFFLRSVFKIKNNIHLLLWYLWELIVVWNLTYLLIKYFWGWEPFSWYGYFDLLGEISSVMIFPFMITEIYKRIPWNSTPSNKKLLFETDNGKESLSISPNEFLYVTSQDNYIDIYFELNGNIKCETLRGTLKAIEQKFSDSESVIRCHRSFIVNPSKIIHLSQSSRAIKAALPWNLEVPVSKKYLSQVKAMMIDTSLTHT